MSHTSSAIKVVFAPLRSCDVTPENERAIRRCISGYYAEAADSGDISSVVMEIFRSGIAKHRDLMLWILRVNGRIGGYMLTQTLERDNLIEIYHGFMEKWARHNAEMCLATIEVYAREHGIRAISFVTRRDPGVYERWIRRFGYRKDYTAFIKEI